MSNLDDLDRALADWLAEGPSTAPEAPLIAAMGHARTTPRRFGPVARLGPDPMASRRASGVVRLVPLFAVGILVTGAVTAAVIGSRSSEPLPIASPTPSSSASPSPSASPPISSSSPEETPRESVPVSTPSALPRITDLPALGAPAVPPVRVVLAACCNEPVVDVVDLSGQLVRATSGPAVDATATDLPRVVDGGPRTIRLAWIGSPCDRCHRVTIERAITTITIDSPGCFGDAIGAPRSVVLTFGKDVDASRIEASIVYARGGVDLPSWTADGGDSASKPYHVAVFDPSQTVESVEAVDPSEGGDPGTGQVDVAQVDATTVRIAWGSFACDVEPMIVGNASGLDWTIVTDPCDPSKREPVSRAVQIRFTGPRAVGDLRIGMPIPGG